MDEALLTMPQWTTSSRLLKLGESIEFEFFLPFGIHSESLSIFTRYLERANPGEAFTAGGDLAWLDGLEEERLDLKFDDGRASITYQPTEAGSYIARWRVGDELFHRYFAVIEDNWIVLRLSSFNELEVEPTLHATGIPLDYRLPIDQYDSENPVFRKLLGFHRQFGDGVIAELPDTPTLSVEERVKEYGEELSRVRSLIPDPSDARAARVIMRHPFDSGYTPTFKQLGLNLHWGQVANNKPWLGIPEFPFFASDVDIRKANQGEGGAVVAHTWDFAGGWHFLGPQSWHYPASRGQWEETSHCLNSGLREAENLTELSGHPAFLIPLYDGVSPYRSFPNGEFTYGFDDEPMFEFVERYQRFLAFEAPKKYKVAYARCIDISDYYRRHFKVTPRTVFVSKTDHAHYDSWWTFGMATERLPVTRERLPWDTATPTLMDIRRTRKYWKDPLSYEYILVEDQKRSIRFERESANPIWWFDYTDQRRGPKGSSITHVETPYVVVVRSGWQRHGDGLTMDLKMLTDNSSAFLLAPRMTLKEEFGDEFKDFAIALWGLPSESRLDPGQIETNANEFVLARNTDGEQHLVLFFDLRPNVEIRVTIRDG